jgi:hypothetical protein
MASTGKRGKKTIDADPPPVTKRIPILPDQEDGLFHRVNGLAVSHQHTRPECL